MNKKSSSWLGSWEVLDSVVNGWFWPEILAARKMQRPVNRLTALRKTLRSKASTGSRLPF